MYALGFTIIETTAFHAVKDAVMPLFHSVIEGCSSDAVLTPGRIVLFVGVRDAISPDEERKLIRGRAYDVLARAVE